MWFEACGGGNTPRRLLQIPAEYNAHFLLGARCIERRAAGGRVPNRVREENGPIGCGCSAGQHHTQFFDWTSHFAVGFNPMRCSCMSKSVSCLGCGQQVAVEFNPTQLPCRACCEFANVVASHTHAPVGRKMCCCTIVLHYVISTKHSPGVRRQTRHLRAHPPHPLLVQCGRSSLTS